jgi:competence protein ComEC
MAVISVGKNSYGHPAAEIIVKLEEKGFRVLRTDEAGDIEVISNGRLWNNNTEKSGAN